MTNPWVEHIKKYAKDHNISYGCALSTPECKNTYRRPSSKPKQKKECKTCKMNKEPHKMYKEPIGPKKPIKQYTKTELLIMAKNIVSYLTGSDQYISAYNEGWSKKSKEDLLKIVNNFKKKYPDFTIKKTPIQMGTNELLW